ncbi:MAG: tRNA (adenosine(37)-N6)-threonylcarbamoyltransferase complex transferase subunit TsaD [Candidatus Omnitrophota bacterium]|nr:tRNA (adenosine(37)-N6)-threonylcarbamoyltransferase complex transferase subunit TsaD [Candidatus Omnitrophota bacterium]
MITLGIETSCDETAVALVEESRVLSSEVSSSVHLHSRYGGVVPEIASRFHVEYIYPVLEKALRGAGCCIGDIGLVAVTQGPGLPGSLLVGIAFAKSISFAGEIPLLGVNHLHAHILSCFLGREREFGPDTFPFVGMVVSGGHTSIFYCRSIKDFSIIGRTKDDAVGEAFDKVAKLLGLGYPGGPVVEERAANFKGKDDIGFPRALLENRSDLDFSFSGIKTAVMYHWRSSPGTEAEKDKVCYSFQEAIIDVLDQKVTRATRFTGAGKLAAGGGVMNNDKLRQRLDSRCAEEGVELYLPPKEYCADNAAMVAALGERLYNEGELSDLFLNSRPGGF